jgi:hypothetical protein
LPVSFFIDAIFVFFIDAIFEYYSGDVGDQFRWTASATTQSSQTHTVEPASKKAVFAAIDCDFLPTLAGLWRRYRL